MLNFLCWPCNNSLEKNVNYFAVVNTATTEQIYVRNFIDLLMNNIQYAKGPKFYLLQRTQPNDKEQTGFQYMLETKLAQIKKRGAMFKIDK